MSDTYPKKLGNVSNEDIVYYLEEKLGGEMKDLADNVLPEFPDDDGDYMLTLTMSDGTATLSWESMS